MVKNIQFAKLLGSSIIKVTLDATNMSKNIVKSLQNNTIPKSTKKQDTDPTSSNFGPSDTMIVDLLRTEIRYTMDGVISQGKSTNDTHADVEDRKDDLENMSLAGGIVTFNYDNETGVTGNIEKITIRKIINDGQDNDETGLTYLDGEAGYTVKITLIKGVTYG